MATPSGSPSQPWYERYEKVVQWITLASVIFGGLLNYLFVARPAIIKQEKNSKLTQQLVEESKKNQNLIDQKILEAKANTEALSIGLQQTRSNLEQNRINQELIEEKLRETKAHTETLILSIQQMRSQIKLADSTIAKMNDKGNKEAEKLALEGKRVEQAINSDKLVNYIVPNFQVKLNPQASWTDSVVHFDFIISNMGDNHIFVQPPKISLILKAKSNQKNPSTDQLNVSMCSAGFITTKESINCGVILRSKATLTGTEYIEYKASFSAKTDLGKNSEILNKLRSTYKKDYIEKRILKNINISGEITR